MLDVFHSTELKYFTKTDGKTAMRHDVFELGDISEMMIETRPTYPSDRLTFSQANITGAQSIRYFNIFFNLNNQFDVNVILEDSKRNFLKSMIRTIINYLEILSNLFSIEFSLLLSFTKRMLYHNQINSKGNKIRFHKDDYNTMREYYITFR